MFAVNNVVLFRESYVSGIWGSKFSLESLFGRKNETRTKQNKNPHKKILISVIQPYVEYTKKNKNNENGGAFMYLPHQTY